jgi:SPP1 gp7 family putative phage head morphogenesis protein
LQGEGIDAIARRVVGSQSQGGANGVTQLTRRAAEGITRTAVMHVTAEARQAVYDANADLFTHERYVATLDSRTTAQCRANDGKLFERNKGPRPPLHFRCRSLRVPELLGEPLGDRPMKEATEQEALRRFTKANGLEGVAKRADLPKGYKGKFDDFAREYIRDRTGTTPATTSYQEFLNRQSAEFQDDVLGKTRGILFRNGGLKLDQFVTKSGQELTLSQLAKRYESEFRAAGIDPDRWK